MDKRIVLDVFAADDPAALLKGAVNAVNEIEGFSFIIPGDPEYISNELKKYSFKESRIEILPASSVIGNNEKPAEAILNKRDSSLVKGVFELKENSSAIGMISAGNTGALMAACAAFLGRLKGVAFPALATFLPSTAENYVCLADCGAIVDAAPKQLCTFGILASALYGATYDVAAPKVGLLNIGAEKEKGNALTKEAYKLLSEAPVNFAGNIEARDVLAGVCDVIVCDGFAGNMVLKSIEGCARFMVKLFITSMKTRLSKEKDKIADVAADVMSQTDLSSLAGAIVIGVNKPVIKAHGNSNEKTIPNAVRQLLKLSEANVIEKTQALINNL